MRYQNEKKLTTNTFLTGLSVLVIIVLCSGCVTNSPPLPTEPTGEGQTRSLISRLQQAEPSRDAVIVSGINSFISSLDTIDERNLIKNILTVPKSQIKTPVIKHRIKTFKLDQNEKEIPEPIKVETITANPDAEKKQKEDEVKLKLEKTILDKSITRLKELKSENIGTRTQASLVFIPPLDIAQPALIQSVSLRNFFQFFNPDSDPTNVRRTVWNEISNKPIYTTKYPLPGLDSNSEVTYNLDELKDKATRQLVVEHIVDQRLKQRWIHTAMDIFSIDIGLTSPSVSVGTNDSTFDSNVDKDFPEFLFGGGIHYEAFSLSFGTVLYRNESKHYKTDPYIGISIDLYKTTLPAIGSDKQVQDRVKASFGGM